MTQRPFRFVHASDFHLERVPAGTADVPDHLRDLIAEAPSALKVGLPLGEAREYAEAVQEAGGKVNILDDGYSEEFNRQRSPMEIRSLQDFTMCPECGHRQIKAEACVKCGFLFFFENKRKRSAR